MVYDDFIVEAEEKSISLLLDYFGNSVYQFSFIEC